MAFGNGANEAIRYERYDMEIPTYKGRLWPRYTLSLKIPETHPMNFTEGMKKELDIASLSVKKEWCSQLDQNKEHWNIGNTAFGEHLLAALHKAQLRVKSVHDNGECFGEGIIVYTERMG